MGSTPPIATSDPKNTELSSAPPNDGAISPPATTATSCKPPSKQLKTTTAAHIDKARNDAAIKEAKRDIRSKLRDDWEWPTSTPYNTTTVPTDPESIHWQERASDSEACSSEETETRHADPYRFNTADAVTTPFIGRKRKRRELLREEMTYNSGLCNFMQRRDAWTGARPQHEGQEPSPYFPCSTSSPSIVAYINGNTDPPIPSKPLIPLVPAILPPSNIVRAGITPSTYPAIYTKVVVQGMAPTIPINLSDVVGALVLGWKKDGEWPPKGEGTGAGDVVRSEKSGLARRGVGRFRKVLGLRGPGLGGD